MASCMKAHEYDSVRQMRGSMSRRAVPEAAERVNYMKVLRSYALKGDRRS
jgi:hypothetical protein